MVQRNSLDHDDGPVIRLLIVDDNTSVRSALQLVLGDLGLQVVGTAQNGQEAAQLCAELAPDVVLMDLVMPVMDGIAATRLIKQQCPDVQIVMLSNFADKEQMEEAFQAGVSNWVSKQTPIEGIVEAIRTAGASTAHKS